MSSECDRLFSLAKLALGLSLMKLYDDASLPKELAENLRIWKHVDY